MQLKDIISAEVAVLMQEVERCLDRHHDLSIEGEDEDEMHDLELSFRGKVRLSYDGGHQDYYLVESSHWNEVSNEQTRHTWQKSSSGVPTMAFCDYREEYKALCISDEFETNPSGVSMGWTVLEVLGTRWDYEHERERPAYEIVTGRMAQIIRACFHAGIEELKLEAKDTHKGIMKMCREA